MTLWVTTSWDDGFVADLRVAELLAKHGLKGTFYVPNRNAEGRPVLSAQEVARLAQGFEIGGHGRDHIPLTALSSAALDEQIRENRQWLGDALGHAPEGFCYVRGRVDRRVSGAIAQAGYRFGRTTHNLRRDAGRDPFLIPTTIQFFPHSPDIYLRNFVRHWGTASPGLLRRALRERHLAGRVLALLEEVASGGGCFHLWGHSWELDERGLWDDLAAVLRTIGAMGSSVRFVDNAGVFRLAAADPGAA